MDQVVLKSFHAGKSETVFRYPCLEDLDAFISLHHSLTKQKVMCRRLNLDQDSGARELSNILSGLEKNRLSYLLIELAGTLVGEGFTKISGHGYCTLGLAILSSARGLGIGTEMMWSLETESSRLGASRLYLDVWSANPSAIHVYKKVGYCESGRRPDWVLTDSGEPCDLIEMIKYLE
jgi:ribosomal protein S18 acetylase RimI-like enzyme